MGKMELFWNKKRREKKFLSGKLGDGETILKKKGCHTHLGIRAGGLVQGKHLLAGHFRGRHRSKPVFPG